MVSKILCVAEKPAIAKGQTNIVLYKSGIEGNQYVKNYEFDFTFGPPWGSCSVVMTSVLGHLTASDFEPRYRNWNSCNPSQLFAANVIIAVDKEKLGIARNIKRQARDSRALFIWTDCDREGEHIGSEVRDQAVLGNPSIEIKRARFSNTERTHVLEAARRPTGLDERQVDAVAARIELDLRIGAAFTRLQTLQLQTLGGALAEKIISYGSCQFPTLGFVVDRYMRVKNFKPEAFWSIKVSHTRDGITVNFNWQRGHLFDRAAVVVLFERCLAAKIATVTKVNKKPTSKWRPLPLTTVDLQMMGSKYLRIDSQAIMKFDNEIDLKKLVEKQYPSEAWGEYARGSVFSTNTILAEFHTNPSRCGGFKQPRRGRNNDKAHPPIHPVAYVSPTVLNANEEKVYEFVTRRFLACCSEDAEGESTDIEIQYGDEEFHTRGLVVLERNYLDVYVYDKWESSQPLPNFVLNESFEPKEANITEGKTVAPGYLTEPELIGLMDANGIGTDATMAEHISKIKAREYVATRPRGGGRGSGGRVDEFIPTKLGVALVEGYDNVVAGLPDCPSLTKPFLRKEMELRMGDICSGTKTKAEVVRQNVGMYSEVFTHTQQRIELLKVACRKYVFDSEN
ncbi:hypothetical protein TRV_06117 [Trichophyton verrucosum HKI 0517]|uniref:DNA topoisomerase n=1 Tax=Trichophyton verrucosum (strain HKI 0517) TaxID=663202 RepID=D4DG15_TRIVH|nr:uncharacterized protein TRV_06117 [Trichophyton verrucosum HKI 0517]EFE39205.1 hypothetical protein TRV_06117 [Trichophyton verrucosum HKI 0517]